MIGALVQALRPHQWVKNLLVFAPLLFGHRLEHGDSWMNALLAFAAFSMASSTVYLLNDTLDREADRKHPVKKNRPIASGRLPVAAALLSAVALLGGTIGIAMALRIPGQTPWLLWPSIYFGVNLAYSLGLKRLAIIDCLCIAVGFMLRVHSGAEALPEVDGQFVESSNWILMCTFFFSLLLAFCKRRGELVRAGGGVDTRATLESYDLGFLDQVIPILAALSIFGYALWTVSDATVEIHDTDNLLFTVPFVVYGVFRYLHVVRATDEGEDPARLLFRDPALLAAGVLYAITVTWILS